MYQKGNIVLIVLIALLLIAGIAYFLISKGIIKNPLQSSFPNVDLGSQIFQKIQSPSGEKVTETNPFAKINPFKGVYKNPFE